MNNCLVDIIEQYFRDITKPGESKTLCVNMQEVVGFTANAHRPGGGFPIGGGTVSVAMRGGGTLECYFNITTGTSEADFDKCTKKLKKDWLAAPR